MPSTRFSSRARRSSERGFALVAAVVLAVLYFALIQLLLIDSSRELAEARRFRSKVIAMTLAENGAELAALQIASPSRTMAEVSAEDAQGTISGRMVKTAGGQFEIQAEGRTTGLAVAKAKVRVFGRVLNNFRVRIQYTMHE